MGMPKYKAANSCTEQLKYEKKHILFKIITVVYPAYIAYQFQFE